MYFLSPWLPLRERLARALRWALGFLGNTAQVVETTSGPALWVDQAALYQITPNCLYLDVVLILSPFCWRFGKSLLANTWRLLLLWLAVLALNVWRVAIAVHMHGRGVSWVLAHTVPDVVLHTSTVLLAVALALRADRSDA